LGAKFVAFGMPTEVVVIVQDQDARGGAGARAIEVGRRQTTDAASHDDQIIGLPRIDGLARAFPKSTVAQRVRYLKRSGMTAAHTGERRRVVAGRILRELSRRFGGSHEPGPEDAQAHGDPIQKVAPGNGPIHAKRPIVRGTAVIVFHTIHVSASVREKGGSARGGRRVFFRR